MTAHAGDAGDVLERVEGPFDLVFTDVPYWNMDVAPRSSGSFKRVGEAARPREGSRLREFGASSGYADKSAWLQEMERVFRLAAARLKPGGYLLSFIGDMYSRRRLPLPVGRAGGHPAAHRPAGVAGQSDLV